MDHQHNDARLSADEITKIRQKMAVKGLKSIYCQLCSEDMQPEQARKTPYGEIVCRPCYMNDTIGADQSDIDQAIREDFPKYAKQFGV